MIENEKADLEQLHNRIKEKKLQTFSTLNYYYRSKPEDLKNTGFKSSDEAILFVVKQALAQIDQWNKDHLKKYTDNIKL